jgi:hypothetical protein
MKIQSEADKFKDLLEVRRYDLRGFTEDRLKLRCLVILHKPGNNLDVLLLGKLDDGLVPVTSGKTGSQHGVNHLKPETAVAKIRAHGDKAIVVQHPDNGAVGELFKNFWDPLVIKQLVSGAVAATQPELVIPFDPFEL